MFYNGFPSIGKFYHIVVSVSIDFPSNSQRDAPFHRLAYDYSHADLVGLRDHLRDVLWEDIFKLDASTAASEFCEWVQVAIDVYIPHRKYQVKSHSSPWFSAACAAAIVHRNHFFHLYQKDKLLDSKAKFRRLVIIAKGLMKLPKLHMLLKQKESITSQKLSSWDFRRNADRVLNIGKSAIPPLFTSPEMSSLYLLSLLELI